MPFRKLVFDLIKFNLSNKLYVMKFLLHLFGEKFRSCKDILDLSTINVLLISDLCIQL